MPKTYATYMGDLKWRVVCQHCYDQNHYDQPGVPTADEQLELVAACRDYIWGHGYCHECGVELDPVLNVPAWGVRDLIVQKPEEPIRLSAWSHVLEIKLDFDEMTDEAIADWLKSAEPGVMRLTQEMVLMFMTALASAIAMLEPLPLIEPAQRDVEVIYSILQLTLEHMYSSGSPMYDLLSNHPDRVENIKAIVWKRWHEKPKS